MGRSSIRSATLESLNARGGWRLGRRSGFPAGVWARGEDAGEERMNKNQLGKVG